MKLVMTLMVRDEADVVEASIRHHVSQGVDQFIVTDNASVDGTWEILERLAGTLPIDLTSDPVHRKQQGETVTRMARDAYTKHGADWVLNADADEFWVSEDGSRTVRETLEEIPTSFVTFEAPVIDMTGAPAVEGAGLQRLVYRDNRAIEELHRLGIFAHSTPDAVHVGDPDVMVAQGNHRVSLESGGRPEPGAGLEVLHLPWRSWTQFERKVANAGRAYESSPTLRPSPNHHGIRDYRLLQDGGLLGSYLLRHPTPLQLEAGLADGGFALDTRISESAQSAAPDVMFAAEARLIAESYSAYAISVRDALNRSLAAEVRSQAAQAELLAKYQDAQDHIAMLSERLNDYARRKSVRVADAASRIAKHPLSAVLPSHRPRP